MRRPTFNLKAYLSTYQLGAVSFAPQHSQRVGVAGAVPSHPQPAAAPRQCERFGAVPSAHTTIHDQSAERRRHYFGCVVVTGAFPHTLPGQYGFGLDGHAVAAAATNSVTAHTAILCLTGSLSSMPHLGKHTQQHTQQAEAHRAQTQYGKAVFIHGRIA
jgi:hypothetical protein